ncbi:hypothetical protein [Streptomyces sp. NPDC059761]|uniref:hypothetical protein n=1 Tax=Streptomyces sp. NPDC059761 TaxID=3346937 RepID=UPI00364CDC93
MTAPDDPQAELALWLDRFKQLRLGDETWAYHTFADLIDRHGAFYPPAPWPAGQHPQRTNQCFAAAHEWADRMGWTYVEGLALVPGSMFPVFGHAWCLTPSGTVADPAIPDGWAAGYLGVPFSTRFRHTLRETRPGTALVTAGPLELGRPYYGPNTTILREGLPPGALAPGAEHAH